ncbi:MAG TPA: aldose 1-epimerase family protein [Thermoproteota archaeon]|nr:aldose 1-epimerase family protein [Thermoproteota archaeon]
MNTLYGKECSKDILKLVGRIEQVGGVRLIRLDQGLEAGVRVAQVRTGTGFGFSVLLDRGMSISDAEYRGAAIGWKSQTGDVGPSYYDPRGTEWLRGFFGGLLTTCGLTWAGAACTDEGTDLGLHGRGAFLPAETVNAMGEWAGDRYVIRVEGRVREARVFGPNMVLTRKIETELGSNRMMIEDTLTNEGWSDTPLMILYHFNIGFPVLDNGARLISTSMRYVPRDKDAWERHEEFSEFGPPEPSFREKVYFHDVAVDNEGYAYTGIINEKFDRGKGIGVSLKFRKDQLSRLIEWKMVGEGEYVVGMEPSNCLVMGRAKEREWNTLQVLRPGESKKIQIELDVLTGLEDTRAFRETVEKITRNKRPVLVKDVDEFVRSSSGH